MADTTFVDQVTPVVAAWLNDVNRLTYDLGNTTDVAKGDALVGVKRTATGAVAQTLHGWIEGRTLSVSDFGTLGTANDASVFQAALDYTTANKLTLEIPAGTWKIGTTLTIANASGFAVAGRGMAAQTAGVVLEWDGAAAGTMLSVRRCREASFANFQIKNGTSTLAVGIEIDQTGAGAVLSTNLAFDRVYVREATVGVYISRLASSNNDLHKFTHCGFYGCSDSGVFINHSQSKFNLFAWCEFAFCGAGIKVFQGSFSSYTCNFSGNTIDINVTSVISDPISITHPQSESAGRFLSASNASAAALPVTVISGRLDTDAVNGDGNYVNWQMPGPLSFIGTSFSSGVYRSAPRLRVGSSTGSPTVLNLTGCILPSTSFISKTTYTEAVTRLDNCLAYDSGSVPRAFTTEPVRVVKTSDEAKTSNTTLADDTALAFYMHASTKYEVRGRMYVDTVAAADFKWRHVGPAAPTLVRVKRSSIIPGATALGNIAVDVAYSAADITELTAGTTGGWVEFEAVIHNGANAGAFSIQWAQNTSDAGATTVRAGSYMEWSVV